MDPWSLTLAKRGPLVSSMGIVGLVAFELVRSLLGWQPLGWLEPVAGVALAVFGLAVCYQGGFILRYPAVSANHDIRWRKVSSWSYQTDVGAMLVGLGTLGIGWCILMVGILMIGGFVGN